MREFFTKRLDLRLGYIDSALASSEFLTGDTLTVVDCYLFIITGWSEMLGYDISEQKNILAWRERLGERESVKEVKATRPPE